MDIYEEVSAFFGGYRGEKRVIGKSADGRNLYAIKIGSGKPCGIAQYAIHAREWITALLGLEHARRGGVKGSVWLLPLTDPDGALLTIAGLSSVKDAARRNFLRNANGGEDFSLWKANINAVDLNVNFDACWGMGKQNVFAPAPANFVGERPFSEPETRALRDFTLEIMPQYTVSWHTKGEEIYWRFRQPVFRAARDKKLALALSAATGYPLKEAKGSVGGYKDWCIRTLKIPAFTVEAGRDDFKHPLGLSALPDLIGKNLDALAALSRAYG